jgi:transmembrane sensor
MPGPLTISEQTKAEAAAWMARIRSDSKTPTDEIGFRQWLAADPSHTAAFEAMNDVWEALGSVRRKPAPVHQTTELLSRRRVVFAGGAAAAAVGTVLMVRGRAEASVFETGIGEQHHVVFADGTQAFLDTSTRLRTTYSGTTRLVELEYGRCNFDVMGDDGRPFMVRAAEAWIVAGLTTVDVAREGDEVSVVLVRGSASVSGGPLAAEKPCVLAPGERLTMRHSAYRLDHPDLKRVQAWQTGQIVFENSTLSDATHELNRYSTVKLEADAAAAPLRISGVFRVGDNIAFSRLAVQLLPVAAHVDANRIVFTKTARNAPKT